MTNPNLATNIQEATFCEPQSVTTNPNLKKNRFATSIECYDYTENIQSKYNQIFLKDENIIVAFPLNVKSVADSMDNMNTLLNAFVIITSSRLIYLYDYETNLNLTSYDLNDLSIDDISSTKLSQIHTDNQFPAPFLTINVKSKNKYLTLPIISPKGKNSYVDPWPLYTYLMEYNHNSLN